jgi:hypothetical protein
MSVQTVPADAAYAFAARVARSNWSRTRISIRDLKRPRSVPLPASIPTLTGKSARFVITTGMPVLVYRRYFRAHRPKHLERNILRFSGIRPIRESPSGMVAMAVLGYRNANFEYSPSSHVINSSTVALPLSTAARPRFRAGAISCGSVIFSL